MIKNTLGYEEFTKGYEYYGFNVQKDGSVMYREWAPNAVTASLVGDFSKYLLLGNFFRFTFWFMSSGGSESDFL
jgi:hypothetical protein